MAGAMCEVCSKMFSKKCNLTRHLADIHAKHAVQKFICYHCNESFKQKFNLIRHINNNHQNQPKSFSIKCVMCNFKGEKKSLLVHYRLQHEIDISTTKMEFYNFEEFENWKKEMESDTISHYVKCNQKKINGKIMYFYRCHRDGFYKPSGKNIRHLKQLGSNKINGYCPSKIDVTIIESSGRVSVKMLETHVGHQMDLERLTLSKTERNHIADQIVQKVPFDEILNNVRDSSFKNNVERIHLLKRKDLYNIEKLYNLNSDSVRRSNDCIKVEAWVEETQENSCDSVVAMDEGNDITGINESNIIDDEGDNLVILAAAKEEKYLIHPKEEFILSESASYTSKPSNPNDIEVLKASLHEKFKLLLSEVTNLQEHNVVEQAVLSTGRNLSALKGSKSPWLPNIPNTAVRTLSIKPQRNVVSTKKKTAHSNRRLKLTSMKKTNSVAVNLVQS